MCEPFDRMSIEVFETFDNKLLATTPLEPKRTSWERYYLREKENSKPLAWNNNQIKSNQRATPRSRPQIIHTYIHTYEGGRGGRIDRVENRPTVCMNRPYIIPNPSFEICLFSCRINKSSQQHPITFILLLWQNQRNNIIKKQLVFQKRQYWYNQVITSCNKTMLKLFHSSGIYHSSSILRATILGYLRCWSKCLIFLTAPTVYCFLAEVLFSW